MNRPTSAYSEGGSSECVISTTTGRKYRPVGSAPGQRGGQGYESGEGGGGKPKMDPKFIADPTQWDPATPNNENQRSMRNRPYSAPVFKR